LFDQFSAIVTGLHRVMSAVTGEARMENILPETSASRFERRLSLSAGTVTFKGRRQTTEVLRRDL
jgi:hypothetical protein